MKFYTNVALVRDEVLLRGYENGERVQRSIKLKPYVFVDDRKGNAEYKTLKGRPVQKLEFDSVYEARDFVKKYQDVDGFNMYGMTNFLYPFINDYYRGEIDYDPSLISVVNLDIEVSISNGFPNLDTADKEITAITLEKNGQYVVLGCGEFKNNDPAVTYIKCSDEANLIMKFMDVWRSKQFSPDVVTGWNIEQFDIPYLINRFRKVVGGEFTKKLSPWGIINEREIINAFGTQKLFELVGISCLDYLAMYKKFSFQMQESYKLDHIAHQELGERKLDYSDYANLQDLYERDYQKYIEYNIKDVALVRKLDQKLKMIEQVYAIAFDGKVNFQDAFTSVRMWDVIIHNYLLNQKIVIPSFKKQEKERQIEGAFVKDPKPGLHKWVVSFDLNSLYPHLMMQYNISPETYCGKVGKHITVDQILDGALSDPALRKEMEEQNITIAATGCMFQKDFKGFLPKLMDKMYEDRVVYKTRMIEAKKKHEESPSAETDRLIAQNHNMQLAKKIQLNSVYGALSNEYFRWFDMKLAESITLSGQLSIRWIERKINQYLNKLFKTENEDYVLACDTDSMYITLDKLVDMAFAKRDKAPTTDEIVSFLDRACQDKIEPYIDKCYEELSVYVNAYDQKMKMKREAIADKGIWLAKKHYILNVYNNEGVQYSEPKLKMMGIEAVKSSTPAPCRESIKKALNVIMTKDEKALVEFVEDFRAKFEKLEFEEVAFPRSCKKLSEYQDSSSIYRKSTPIHVRGALVYNHAIKQKKIKAQAISDGDKIKFCYLKLPNPIKENVISVPLTLPRELGIDKYIDYNTQFEKSFLEFIRSVTEVIGWEIEKKATLENFFG